MIERSKLPQSCPWSCYHILHNENFSPSNERTACVSASDWVQRTACHTCHTETSFLALVCGVFPCDWLKLKLYDSFFHMPHTQKASHLCDSACEFSIETRCQSACHKVCKQKRRCVSFCSVVWTSSCFWMWAHKHRKWLKCHCESPCAHQDCFCAWRFCHNPVVNFINILQAAFLPIFLRQKITKQKHN